MYDEPGPHETEIRRHFAGDSDYCGGVRIHSPLFLMAFTNRCGSNLLGEYLRGLQDFDGFLELLIHYRLIGRCVEDGITSPAEYMLRLHGESPARHYGYKVNPEQLAMVFRLGLSRLFSSVKVIHISRDDVIDQAISFSIADQTKVWWSLNDPTGLKPNYSFEDIYGRLQGIMASNASIPVTAAVGGAEYLHLIYEDLLSDPMRELRRFCAFASVESPEHLPTPRISKQATPVNTQFRSQFIHDMRARMGLDSLNAASQVRS